MAEEVTLADKLADESKKIRIKDFISGKDVTETPEEREAVQPFSRILVEDYGYPKDHIQTRPQWRVRARPSDNKKEYPVDIAVFSSAHHTDDNLYLVVECKKKKRKDGQKQLEDYLRFSTARLGVWFNGNETLYLLKSEKEGRVTFMELPNIPVFGQRVDDIGLFKRKDLRPSRNLKTALRSIRNYLAAQAVGAVRDEVFAENLINIILCKIYDERFTKPNDIVTFRAGVGESAENVHARILGLFNTVKNRYKDVLDRDDHITLDPTSLKHVVGELQNSSLKDSTRDAVADAFEVFISPSLKGSQGQFFTPRNVVKLLVGMLAPDPDAKVIDPACGSGGFLVEALREVWREIDVRGKELNWPQEEIDAEKQQVAIKNFRGIDKDTFLSKVAKAYMAVIGDGRGGVFCENSLLPKKGWSSKARDEILFGTFQYVLTNPPFGQKIRVEGDSVLKQFDLGHRWTEDKKTGEHTRTSSVLESQSPQILFIERCLELLKEGAYMGIMLPESMFCNPSHRFIIQYLEQNAKIQAIVSMPEELFQPHTHAKACAVVIQKSKTGGEPDDEIFMGIAKWCGHDSRGSLIPYDDVPKILDRYLAWKKAGKLKYDHLGFVLKRKHIRSNIYLPKYYNPEIERELKTLRATHDLVSFSELAEQHGISVSTGHEVGKLAYGTGRIPFIRSSDISNWEIKIDAKHGVSEDIFQKYAKRQDVREHDIFMVRDGTYLVGTCAIATKYDTKILYQSHIYKIRSLDHEALNPYLLLAILSSPIVKEQIYAKRFTQDIIDTLGGRLHELVLPIPRDEQRKIDIIKTVKNVIERRSKAREEARQAALSVAPTCFGAESLEPESV
jgi:type I restriction enzyme M protein